MEYKDYYKILNVDKNASQDDIKRSYRRLAKKYHPDLNPDNEEAQEKFKEVNEAYEVLGDKDKKEKYDMFGINYNFSGGQNFDPSQNGFGNGHTYTYTSSGGEGFSDFFNMFFGGDAGGFDISNLFGGASRGQARPQRQTIDSELDITIEEGYKGTSKNIGLNIGGQTKNISVKVPKGILPGKKLRVRGEKRGLDRDILFNINFKDDPKKKLKGLDITSNIDVLPWEAALGTKLVVDTLAGKIRITIPKGIQ